MLREATHSQHNPFYDTRPWRKLRRRILTDANNECQLCKLQHTHSMATIAHHIYHLEDYPQYGLMEFVDDPLTGQRTRNLIAVCKTCHETVCHPERLRKVEHQEPLTKEKW